MKGSKKLKIKYLNQMNNQSVQGFYEQFNDLSNQQRIHITVNIHSQQMKRERIGLKQLIYFSNTSSQIEGKGQNYKKKFINLATEAYQESQSVDKQNQGQECGKKVKLKLKTNPSRQFQRNSQIKLSTSSSIQKTEKPQDNCYALKVANKKMFNELNPDRKKSKMGSNFKPNVVYFQLKSLKQSVKPSIQIKKGTDEPKSKQAKERQKVKNYQLSSFVSQVVSKLAELYPSILSHEPKLKDLSSQEVCYSDLMVILHSLGMIRFSSQEKYKIESEDQKGELQKVYLLWKVFKLNQIQIQSRSSNTSNINALNVIAILTVIHNITFESVEQLTQMIMEKIQQVSTKQSKLHQNLRCKIKNSQEPTHIFFIRNKNLLKQFQSIQFQDVLILNPNQQIKTQITKEFELFRINRLKIQNHPKTIKENLSIDITNTQGNIQSLLSLKSQQLAMTRRLRILEEIQNSGEISVKKEAIQNLFLNYKKPQKCNHECKPRVSKELFKKYQRKQVHKKDSKQLKPEVNKNKYIPSQKIKFSELNVVQNMQKARRMKLQKQLILQKGWTNSGQISSRSSKLNATQQKKESSKTVIQGTRSLSKSKSLSKVQQNRANLLQNRKKSIQIPLKNEQAILNSSNQVFKQKEINYRKKNYEKDQEFFENDEDEKNTVIRHESDEDLNDTDSINELQPIELQNRNFTNEYDFLIEYDETFQKLNESLQIITKTNNNNCEQQKPYEPESSSKTFRTQVNEQNEPQDQGSVSKKPVLQNRASQQTRVIKSYLKIPILYVDVNMDESKKERIIIYEEDNPTILAQEFGKKHGLDSLMVGRLQQMLKQQISGILGRIDEEEEDDYDEANDNIQTQHENDV